MKSFETWWAVNMPKDPRYESAYHKALLKDGWQAALKEVEHLMLSVGTPPDPQHGREPDKVKPLAQYLAEYIEHEVELDNISEDVGILFAYNSWRELLEQALDAYQSAENVTIKIERNVE